MILPENTSSSHDADNRSVNGLPNFPELKSQVDEGSYSWQLDRRNSSKTFFDDGEGCGDFGKLLDLLAKKHGYGGDEKIGAREIISLEEKQKLLTEFRLKIEEITLSRESSERTKQQFELFSEFTQVAFRCFPTELSHFLRSGEGASMTRYKGPRHELYRTLMALYGGLLMSSAGKPVEDLSEEDPSYQILTFLQKGQSRQLTVDDFKYLRQQRLATTHAYAEAGLANSNNIAEAEASFHLHLSTILSFHDSTKITGIANFVMDQMGVNTRNHDYLLSRAFENPEIMNKLYPSFMQMGETQREFWVGQLAHRNDSSKELSAHLQFWSKVVASDDNRGWRAQIENSPAGYLSIHPDAMNALEYLAKVAENVSDLFGVAGRAGAALMYDTNVHRLYKDADEVAEKYRKAEVTEEEAVIELLQRRLIYMGYSPEDARKMFDSRVFDAIPNESKSKTGFKMINKRVNFLAARFACMAKLTSRDQFTLLRRQLSQLITHDENRRLFLPQMEALVDLLTRSGLDNREAPIIYYLPALFELLYSKLGSQAALVITGYICKSIQPVLQTHLAVEPVGENGMMPTLGVVPAVELRRALSDIDKEALTDPAIRDGLVERLSKISEPNLTDYARLVESDKQRNGHERVIMAEKILKYLQEVIAEISSFVTTPVSPVESEIAPKTKTA